jgi:hypothetical protein
VAGVARPDTILAWYQKLIAQKFDGSKYRAYPGRPAVGREITELVLRVAREVDRFFCTRFVHRTRHCGHFGVFLAK